MKRGEADGRWLWLSICTPYPPTHTLALAPWTLGDGGRCKKDKGQFHQIREWFDPWMPLDSLAAHSSMGHSLLYRPSEAWGGPSRTGVASDVEHSLLLVL